MVERLAALVGRADEDLQLLAGLGLADVVVEQLGPQRLGLMKGRVKILDDLDTMYADEIARMFNGED